MNCSATVMPKRKPEQAAAKSNAQQPCAPSSRWISEAVEGKGMSGEIVEQMIRSRSVALIPAFSRAWREACTERVEVVSWGAAWRRSRMPVRSVIHWSEVSTIFSRSALVITFSGKAEPVPSTPATHIETPEN